MEQLKLEALKQIEEASDLSTLENIRIVYLSKKGSVTELMKQLKDMSPDERKMFGESVNLLKQTIEEALNLKKIQLEMTPY